VPPTPRYEGKWYVDKERNRDGGGHASVEASPATYATERRTRASAAPLGTDRAAHRDNSPDTGGGAHDGANRGTGGPRKPQHAGVGFFCFYSFVLCFFTSTNNYTCK